jgi:putative nucleotidyltransferase with HDIG domain
METRVLVVADEPGSRDVQAAWLSAEGYSCAEVGDAGAALFALRTWPADVALIDLSRGDRDALDLAHELRRRSPDLAIVLVSSSGLDVTAEGMRLGVRDYLLKPYTRLELVAAVRRAAEWRESQHRQVAEGRVLRAEIAARRDELAGLSGMPDVRADAIGALVAALGRRDPEAPAHALRIRSMASALAGALGMDGQARADIERGALLHDIGKLALPDALIYKAGPLSEDEIALIRTHPSIGAEVLGSLPAFAAVAEIVGASHEAWDGSGYPRGLAGRDIPIGSRIIAIVDTYDALTRGHLRLDAVSQVRAAVELVRCAGQQFDPDIVNRWLRVAERSSGVNCPIAWEEQAAS